MLIALVLCSAALCCVDQDRFLALLLNDRYANLERVVARNELNVIDLCGAGQVVYDTFEYVDDLAKHDEQLRSISRHGRRQQRTSVDSTNAYRIDDDDREWLRELLIRFDMSMRPRVAWSTILMRHLIDERSLLLDDAVRLLDALNELKRETLSWTQSQIQRWLRSFVNLPELVPNLATLQARELCTLSDELLQSTSYNVKRWLHRRRVLREAQVVLPIPRDALLLSIDYALQHSMNATLATSTSTSTIESLLSSPSSTLTSSIAGECWTGSIAPAITDSAANTAADNDTTIDDVVEFDERIEELEYEYEYAKINKH